MMDVKWQTPETRRTIGNFSRQREIFPIVLLVFGVCDRKAVWSWSLFMSNGQRLDF